MMGLVGATTMIDRLINESEEDGEVNIVEQIRFRETYQDHDLTTRARIRGFIERRMKEALDAQNMRKVRAITNLMQVMNHGSR